MKKRCSICDLVMEATEAEDLVAVAEFVRDFPEDDLADGVVLCDDCFAVVMATTIWRDSRH